MTKINSNQNDITAPRKLSRFHHGIISGFIFLIAGILSDWSISNVIFPLESSENRLLIGLLPIAALIISFGLPIWVANILLKRFGYLPMRFFNGDRHINGESIAGCMLSYILIPVIIIIGFLVFTFFQTAS